MRDWAPRPAHVIRMEGEVGHLTGNGDVDAAPAQVGTRMRSDALLVVKQGAAGATAWTGSASHAWPAPSLPVVDTIGAGDVFNAYYLAALLRRRDVRDAVRSGGHTASLAVPTSPRRQQT